MADNAVTAVTKYNGIYMKQTTLVNGKDWWKQRFTDATHLEIIGPAHEGRTSTLIENESASVYWSNSDDRWILEALDVSWKSPQTLFQQVGEFNEHDDDRQIADQYRVFVTAHRIQARVLQLLEDKKHEEALEKIRRGIQEVEEILPS